MTDRAIREAYPDFPGVTLIRWIRFLGCVAACIIPCTSVAAAAEPLWIARYDVGPYSREIACAIAVDSTGNSYVTGLSGGPSPYEDYLTLKYNTNGELQWAARYSPPWPGDDLPYAIALDRWGNVYVTGLSMESSTGGLYKCDYATVKYRGASGEQVWVARYNGPSTSYSTDIARAIAVGSSGDVYVTGYSSGETTHYDITTVRFDSTGRQRWVARYDGGTGPYCTDFGCGVAVDSSGNVYVGGDGDRGHYYIAICYDSLGNERWLSTTPGYDATSMAIDRRSNIYLFGTSLSGSYQTVKFDSAGHRLWTAYYIGPGRDDYGWAVAVDDTGNTYVTGQSVGIGTREDIATVKYDSAGRELWAARYDGPGAPGDRGNAIATDGKNVYVAGWAGIGYCSAFCTIKYDADGHEQWVGIYTVPDYNHDAAYGLALDRAGYIYVTGGTVADSVSSDDFCTMKYHPDGVAAIGEDQAVPSARARTRLTGSNIVRGTLQLQGERPAMLMDITGNKKATLKPGANDIRHLPSGVYFVCDESNSASAKVLVRR